MYGITHVRNKKRNVSCIVTQQRTVLLLLRGGVLQEIVETQGTPTECFFFFCLRLDVLTEKHATHIDIVAYIGHIYMAL